MIMSSIQRISVLLFLWFTTCSGYISNKKHLQTKPLDIPAAPAFIPKVSSYDLGLGKNLPVTNAEDEKAQTKQSEDISNVYQAVRYLTEHESGTHHFPSPLDDDATTAQSPQKRQRKVAPKRYLEDVLVIKYPQKTATSAENESSSSSNAATKQLPVMVQPGDHQLDVNSVWVEMLIHHQLFA